MKWPAWGASCGSPVIWIAMACTVYGAEAPRAGAQAAAGADSEARAAAHEQQNEERALGALGATVVCVMQIWGDQGFNSYMTLVNDLDTGQVLYVAEEREEKIA